MHTHEGDRLKAGEDDLTVARRVHLSTLERATRQKLSLLSVLMCMQRAERALERGNQEDASRALGKARRALGFAIAGGDAWPTEARVGDEVSSADSIGPFHRYRGMWRPPVPPLSPQQLGRTAVVCSCLEELANALHVRQHWEAGCFDLPEFKHDRETEVLSKELGGEDAD
jgi:hypothetical protein